MEPSTKRRFKPSWPNASNHPDGLFVPNRDDGERSPHPWSPPQEVLDIISNSHLHPHSHDPLSSSLLKTFEPFPRLPLELRRMIWRHSLPGSRIVELFYDDETGVCRSSCPVPLALKVNQESRIVALESYELCFATKKASAMIYFNFDVDELYLGAGNFSPPNLDSPVVACLKTLRTIDLSRLLALSIDTILSAMPMENEDDLYEMDINDNLRLLYPQYGLTRLQSLTLIESTVSPEVDIVLNEVKDNSGEFQGWAVYKTGQVASWNLPLNTEVEEYAVCVSEFWANLEVIKQGEISLKTLRIVSADRLALNPRWKERVEFLCNSCYVIAPFSNGCYYPAGGVSEALWNVRYYQNSKYQELEHKLSEGRGETIDPLHAYLCQNTCICRSGHRHLARIYSEETLAGMDIRKAFIELGNELCKPYQKILFVNVP